MRINTLHKLHSVSNENIIIRQDDNVADLNTVLGLNESALLLYRTFAGRDFTMQDVVEALCNAYEVDAATAQADAEAWIGAMRSNNLIED